jgi:hypothetical protein
MGTLNVWQRIDRVVPGKPWGDATNTIVDGQVSAQGM